MKLIMTGLFSALVLCGGKTETGTGTKAISACNMLYARTATSSVKRQEWPSSREEWDKFWQGADE